MPGSRWIGSRDCSQIPKKPALKFLTHDTHQIRRRIIGSHRNKPLFQSQTICPVVIAQRLTGYVVGGISPFGQKKRLRTAVDETCLLFDSIFVSGGRRGLDIEIAPEVLVSVLDAVVAPIAADP